MKARALLSAADVDALYGVINKKFVLLGSHRSLPAVRSFCTTCAGVALRRPRPDRASRASSSTPATSPPSARPWASRDGTYSATPGAVESPCSQPHGTQSVSDDWC